MYLRRLHHITMPTPITPTMLHHHNTLITPTQRQQQRNNIITMVLVELEGVRITTLPQVASPHLLLNNLKLCTISSTRCHLNSNNLNNHHLSINIIIIRVLVALITCIVTMAIIVTIEKKHTKNIQSIFFSSLSS